MPTETETKEKTQHFAFIAMKKANGFGGASSVTFAFLPNPDVKLPQGWEWAKEGSGICRNDITRVVDLYGSVEEVCRALSTETGIVF